MTRLSILILFSVSLLAWGDARNVSAPFEKQIGFDQKMSSRIAGDLSFRNEYGEQVRLGQYYDKGPVVLALVYYGCPNLCTLVMNGVFKGLQELPFDAGKTFSVIFVSIDPLESPKLALEKRKNYLKKYHRKSADLGIHFLTGNEASIRALASQVGFRYVYDKPSGQYAHPAGITILTPSGQISRYLFGIEFPGRDLRLALVEASQFKIGSPLDKFLLFCFHYDPLLGKYSVRILTLLRLLAILTVAALFAVLYGWIRKERLTALSHREATR